MAKFCPKCGVNVSETTQYCPNCGVEIASFLVPPEQQQDAPGTVPASDVPFKLLSMHPLAIAICVIYTVWFIADTFLNNSLAYAVFSLVITLGIGYLCGEYAAKNWAPKIQGSPSLAFTLPFTMNLLGFVCYWFFYKYYLDKKVWYLIGFFVMAAIIIIIWILFMVLLANPSLANPEAMTGIANSTSQAVETYGPGNTTPWS